jgi:hypothetical protein
LRLTSTFRATLAVSSLLLAAFAGTANAAPTCTGAANEAQDLRAANRLRDARVQLLICSRPTCNSVVRSGCEKWLKEIDEQQPSIVVRAVDARGRDVLGARAMIDDVAIELDGSAAPVDPGQHVVRLKAKSGDVAERPVLVALGEKARVIELRFGSALAQDGTRASDDATASSDSPRDKDRAEAETPKTDPVPLVLLGTGVVAAAVFVVFEVIGQKNYSDLENGCYRDKSCKPEQVDPVRTQFVIAGISLGVSAVAFAAAALMHFAAKPPPPKRGARISPLGFTF